MHGKAIVVKTYDNFFPNGHLMNKPWPIGGQGLLRLKTFCLCRYRNELQGVTRLCSATGKNPYRHAPSAADENYLFLLVPEAVFATFSGATGTFIFDVHVQSIAF